MVKKLVLYRFKRFRNQTFEFKPKSVTVLAGGNNSGKSTILHGFAVWEFCKTVLTFERGLEYLHSVPAQGVGLSADEFLPIAVPSLKHLWTNLKSHKEEEEDGYTLKIGCEWEVEVVVENEGSNEVSNGTMSGGKKDCYLEFGLALVNDRLFIKPTASNLTPTDPIPTLAYLPTLSGVSEKENKMSVAERKRQIGKGLAGSVLRNMILDMYQVNQQAREVEKQGRKKMRKSVLQSLRENDAYELLQQTLRDTFNSEITVQPFNDLYHTNIKVECAEGQYMNNRFYRHSKYSVRDIMVEGSGFLQWLSVFSLALNKEIDVLLLDEPDVHLHGTLQQKLLEHLQNISKANGKQVLLTTHSSEVIKICSNENIMHIRDNGGKYLQEEGQKTGLLAGLGSDYAPKLNQLQRVKKMLIVENESDANFLKIWCNTLGLRWPENVVIWACTSGHRDRKHLIIELQKEIPGLMAISLRDRDDENYNTVDEKLFDRNYPNTSNGILNLKWRRRHIESYLIVPPAIARASGRELEEILQYFAEKHSLAIGENYATADVPSSIYEAWAKEMVSTGPESVEKVFGCPKHEIAKAMEPEEICEDVKILLDTLIKFSNDELEVFATEHA